VVDVPAQISPSKVKSAGFSPIIPFLLSTKGCLHSALFFSLTIIVALLPLPTWINQMYMAHGLPERKREYGAGILLLEQKPAD